MRMRMRMRTCSSRLRPGKSARFVSSLFLTSPSYTATRHAAARPFVAANLKHAAITKYKNVKRAAKDPPEPPLEPTCAFCRAPIMVTDEESLQRYQKRMSLGDANAFNTMANEYEEGRFGLPRDKEKACELYLRAVDLGSALACWNMALKHREGGHFGQNEPKEIYYLKLAAKRGNVTARHVVGVKELKQGNLEVAVKHFMISAEAGHDESLKLVGLAYRKKDATKIQYENAIRAHQKAKKEMSSDERDMAKKLEDAGNDLSALSASEWRALCGIRDEGRTSRTSA